MTCVPHEVYMKMEHEDLHGPTLPILHLDWRGSKLVPLSINLHRYTVASDFFMGVVSRGGLVHVVIETGTCRVHRLTISSSVVHP